MRYSRTAPVFSDVTLSPCFFLIIPEIAPRTECACQFVALERSPMLAPFGRRSIAMILSILPGLRVMDFFDTEAVADLFKDGLLVDVGCAAVVRCLFDNGFEDFALLI